MIQELRGLAADVLIGLALLVDPGRYLQGRPETGEERRLGDDMERVIEEGRASAERTAREIELARPDGWTGPWPPPNPALQFVGERVFQGGREIRGLGDIHYG